MLLAFQEKETSTFFRAEATWCSQIRTVHIMCLSLKILEEDSGLTNTWVNVGGVENAAALLEKSGSCSLMRRSSYVMIDALMIQASMQTGRANRVGATVTAGPQRQEMQEHRDITWKMEYPSVRTQFMSIAVPQRSVSRMSRENTDHEMR